MHVRKGIDAFANLLGLGKGGLKSANFNIVSKITETVTRYLPDETENVIFTMLFFNIISLLVVTF